MRWSTVTIMSLTFLMCSASARSYAATNTTITLQGRLTNALTGEPVADGAHPSTVAFQRTDNGQFVQAFPVIQTTDGFFTLDISDLPLELFECNAGATDCLQVVAMTVDGQAFPDIVVTNSGRSAVTSRVDGDIHTGPSQIDIPASDAFNPQTATISDVGLNYTDNNGQPVFNLDTKITGSHPERTLDVDAKTTITGVTQVNGRLNVDMNGDQIPDLVASNVEGFKVTNAPITFDSDGDGLGNLNIDPSGNIRMYTNLTGIPSLEVLTNGTIGLHGTAINIDRDNDFVSDVSFLSSGTVNFNTDADAATEVSFSGLRALYNLPVSVDWNANGISNVAFGETAGQMRVDVNDDLTSEQTITATETTIRPALIVDHSNAGTGSALVCTNNFSSFNPQEDAVIELKASDRLVEVQGDFTARCDDCPAIARSFAVLDDRVAMDGDHDGADEVVVQGSGVTINSELSVFCDDLPATTIGAAFNDVRIDSDQDGSPEVSISTASIGLAALVVNCDADLTVTGNKSFVQDHPTDPSKEIVYVSLEAGEAGTYTRGSGRLSAGASVIALPEHFRLVTNESGLTVQITPRGPVHSMLYVESVSPTELIVKASSPADTDVPFDFMVNGVRLGFEGHEPVRDKPGYATSR